MAGVRVKRVEFEGVAKVEEIKMDSMSMKVLVKNLTDEDLYAGIGKASEVSLDNSVLIKSNCFQVLMMNENPECAFLFEDITLNGKGFGVVELQQILF